jgi:hypothetical protein
LPGQSSGGDARAIIQWAHLLALENDNYFNKIRELGEIFRALHSQKFGLELDDAELLLCLVGYLAHPPQRWIGNELPNRNVGSEIKLNKLPGMSYTLASEFMRNLRWNGFKPDRHIRRLLSRWSAPGLDKNSDTVVRLLALIGREAFNLREYLQFSLLGIRLSPVGAKLSEVDNLVWLLGHYVERKGKESPESYLLESCG